MSTNLIYLPEKNFRAGDWVLYEVQGENGEGAQSFDYQKLQIASEIRFRGDDCFWLETGYGPYLDKLSYTAVLMSTTIFEDSLAEVRSDVHLRQIHMGSAPDGTPLVGDARLANAHVPMSDLRRIMPQRRFVGTDTVRVGTRVFPCQIFEETQENSALQNLPDSTVRLFTKTKRRRWMNPAIPITGMARESERKDFYRHSWPLGQLSSAFPPVQLGFLAVEVQLVDLGTGAKPAISDRFVHVGSNYRRDLGTP